MDFFTRQREARHLSRLLVVLFVFAVLGVILAVDAVLLTLIANFGPERQGGQLALPSAAWLAAHPGAVFWTSLFVLAVILLSSLFRSTMLRAGGGAVARSLGGERVPGDTQDPLRRRLLNVVEEMSIASGVPMPEVYVLEREAGINAFAAGHEPGNAAIAVTRGTLELLSRDELQGVIAHEFSHVLNGDMRLNVRLIGLVFGLLVIALIARTVLRHAPRARSGGRSGGALPVILAAALAVFVIGYVGLFFGRLIQAAVSRRRESLADASAVQFTRDIGGLKGALLKIGASGAGSRFSDADAEEVAHMLFAPGVRRLFATHPPLEDRLRSLDPRFDPREIETLRAQMALEQTRAATAEAAQPGPDSRERLDRMLGSTVTMTPAAVAHLVGNPGSAHADVAQALRETLPVAVVAAAERTTGSIELLFALALDPDPGIRARQLALIGERLGMRVANGAESRQRDVAMLNAAQRIPAVTRLFPSLRQLSRPERTAVLGCLTQMLAREAGSSIYPYALRKLAQVNLRDELEPSAARHGRSLDGARDSLGVVFSVLAAHGHGDSATARQAYEIGMHHLLPRHRPAFEPPADWPARLDAALDDLDRLQPAGKELLVEALVKTIAHDGRLTVAESELLRAVCAAVHCPLPPLITADSAPLSALDRGLETAGRGSEP
jgi:Zn-dependent protease with chaperone function